MRILLIILSLSALIFIGWLGMNITGKNPGVFSNNNSSQGINANTNQNQTTGIDNITIEQLKHQIKTEQELAEIKAQLSQITGKSHITNPKNTENEGISNETQKQTEDPKNEETIPISAKFLGKILPTIELTKKENSGIFDLRIFDNTAYSTYSDDKFGMTVVASLLPYENFLKNFQAIDKEVYTINTKTPFPFESFYVNPKKTDALVRLVFKVEIQTLFITLPKSKFNTFKELILKKNS